MKIKLLLVLVFISLLSAQLHAQVLVSGTIRDESGSELPGAAIYVKGTNQGTVTDLNGNFKLEVPKDAVLTITFLGFESQEVVLGGRTRIDINLKEESSLLDEIVVVGYGAVKKRDLTGSVASVTNEDFNIGSISSTEQLLQGRAAGVQVSTQSSEPGGNFIIRIRGNNSIQNSNQPIFVVDGFPVDNLSNSIDPSNIESIEILKDASATAIYGTRGANGVVIITTKSASKGKLTLSYNAEFGLQKVSNLDTYQFMSTREFTENENLLARVDGSLEPYSDERIDNLIESFGSGTNWLEESFRDGVTSNHQVSVTSGTDATNVYLAVGHFRNNGVIPNTKFSRTNARINLQQKLLNDKLNAGLNMAITSTETNFLGFNANNLQSNVMRNIFNQALPYVPANIDELSLEEREPLFGTVRPVSPLETIYMADNQSKSLYLLNTGFLEYEVIENLKVKVLGGARLTNSKQYGYLSQESNNVSGTLAPGEASLSNSQVQDLLFEGTVNYIKKFGKHSINALGGYTNQQVTWEGFSAGASDFSSNAIGWNALGGGQAVQPQSSFAEQRLISFLGRAMYNYDDRYLLTLTVRRDGSSKFGVNNKWANFPAVAVAWNLHNEQFMPAQNVISSAKIRASYGITGSERFRVGLAQTQFVANAQLSGVTLDGNNLSVGTIPTVLGNDNLRWEETKQLDIGFDISLLQNRVNFTFDYYKKNTTGLIANKALPPSLGFGSIISNLGEIENTGFEFLISTQNISDPDFSWSTDLNLSINNNKIVDVDLVPGTEYLEMNEAQLKPIGILPFTTITIIQEGLPTNSFFGYKTRGVLGEGEVDAIQPDAVPGDPLYVDVNEDGVISSDDRTVLGQGFPKYILGLTNTFKYKSVSLSLFLTGVFDVDLLNVNRDIGYRSNRLISAQNRWTPETADGTLPFRNHTGEFWMNDQIVESGDYIRLKNVVVSYDFPKEKLGFALQVYASGTNLVTWTNYSGFDPEVSSRSGSGSNLNIVSGVDMYSYPMQRTFTAGIKVDF